MKLKRLIQSAIALALASAALAACTTSPTGRNQLLLFSEDQLSNTGAQAFDAMKQQQKVSSNPTTNRYVQCIADAITAQVPDTVFAGKWEVVVFDEPQVNAFALPGGKIGVYTGLLEVAVNQHQVAAVIGHEVAHVIAEHGNERMSQSTLIGMGQQAVAAVLAANEVAYSAPIMSALGLGVQFGIALPYSRSHESEADIIGLDLMAKAGFDPQESVKLWRNMEQQGGSRPPEFMSTHPAPQTRINDLNAQMNNAQGVYNSTVQRPNCG